MKDPHNGSPWNNLVNCDVGGEVREECPPPATSIKLGGNEGSGSCRWSTLKGYKAPGLASGYLYVDKAGAVPCLCTELSPNSLTHGLTLQRRGLVEYEGNAYFLSVRRGLIEEEHNIHRPNELIANHKIVIV